jgi:biopolymer transport protein ExbB
VIVLWFLSSSVAGLAAAPASQETLGQLSVSAEQELAKGMQELAQLREQVAAEKLPLAQDLTASEEKLAQVRRDYDNIQRKVDAGSLDVATLRSTMKARQDELTYVGNLLDEYARSFESKVGVSELQYCGQALVTAKQATENSALSMTERFTQQTAFVNVSLKRLNEAVGGLRFPGVAVDLKGSVVEGEFAVIGPVTLFSSRSGPTSGLAIPQSGSTKPLVRPVDGRAQAGIASLVESGEGMLPLDPSRGGAIKAMVQKTSLIRIFRKGGPIMWPLLVAAILALGTVIERILFLLNEQRKRDPRALEDFFAAVDRGDMEGAVATSEASKFYVVRTLGYALAHREQSLTGALLCAQEKELKRFRRGIPVLDTVITLAPLLGLLGTVTGMMGSFSLIGGELSAPGAITGGIAEALIATAFGLGIAITSLIPFNILNSRLDEARHEIESAAKELELEVGPVAAATAAAAAQAGASGFTHGGNEYADELAAARQEEQRQERDLQRKRDTLQKQMADLKSKIDEQVVQMQRLADQERGLRGLLVRDLPAEE